MSYAVSTFGLMSFDLNTFNRSASAKHLIGFNAIVMLTFGPSSSSSSGVAKTLFPLINPPKKAQAHIIMA